MAKRTRRPRGSGGIYKRPGSRYWWISWYSNGRARQESSGSVVKEDAKALLQQRLSAVAQGRAAIGRPVTVTELKGLIDTDHTNNSKRSSGSVRVAFLHLCRVLGAKTKARDVTEEVIERYKTTRRNDGAEVSSINLELAWLRRGMRLAVKFRRLGTMPEITLMSGANIRRGFLDWRDLDQIARSMKRPGDEEFCRFLFATGWRVSEAAGLEWRQVDRRNKVITLEENKSDDPRTLPYGTYQELEELIERRAAATGRLALSVFPEIVPASFRERLKTAARKKGHPNLLPHDLRRAMVKHLRRLGVPREIIMKIGGWRSESTYRRYAITDENDIREALAKVTKKAG